MTLFENDFTLNGIFTTVMICFKNSAKSPSNMNKLKDHYDKYFRLR